MTPIERLYEEGLLSELSFERIKAYQKDRGISVHWELKTILYLGVLLLSSGLGIVVYKNIDSIGHQIALHAINILICKKLIGYAETVAPFIPHLLYFSFCIFAGPLENQRLPNRSC